eukprot:gene11062-biopygen13901
MLLYTPNPGVPSKVDRAVSHADKRHRRPEPQGGICAGFTNRERELGLDRRETVREELPCRVPGIYGCSIGQCRVATARWIMAERL